MLINASSVNMFKNKIDIYLIRAVCTKKVGLSIMPVASLSRLYVKESIQAYEIKLDCDEAVWCKIVSGNSKLTVGLVYQSPNINEEDNTKIRNAIKEVSKGECIIMGDINHGHIQWNSLESTGIEDQQFLFFNPG